MILRHTRRIGKPTKFLGSSQCVRVLEIFEKSYPECYGYTDCNVQTGDNLGLLRVFRNREESFNLSNPHLQIWTTYR